MSDSISLGPAGHLATTQRLHLGEGPLWHPGWQQLLVVDVPRGDIHRFDLSLSLQGTLALGRATSAMTLQPDGSIVCFHDRGEISRIRHPHASPESVVSIPEESAGMFNDVIADPAGRVLCGALPIGNRPGCLYRIETDLSYRVLLDDLLEPNGMAFTADGRLLYFADSVAQTVWRIEYDPESGSLGERKAFWRTRGEELPDGLTVDAQGNVVCAVWNAACVVRLSPAGDVIERLSLPAKRVTSVAYGGTTLDALYVTSALQDGSVGAGDECAGAVFRLVGAGCGRPDWPSRLSV